MKQCLEEKLTWISEGISCAEPCFVRQLGILLNSMQVKLIAIIRVRAFYLPVLWVLIMISSCTFRREIRNSLPSEKRKLAGVIHDTLTKRMHMNSFRGPFKLEREYKYNGKDFRFMIISRQECVYMKLDSSNFKVIEFGQIISIY